MAFTDKSRQNVSRGLLAVIEVVILLAFAVS